MSVFGGKSLTVDKSWRKTVFVFTYLHVCWWNLFPFKKHLFGDSTHSQMHFAGFSGWCLGHVFLHAQWHLSSSNSLLGPHELGSSLFLHVHWQDVLSNSLWAPQLEGLTPPLQTHWHVSSSSSLLGPQRSWNPSEESRGASEHWEEWILLQALQKIQHICCFHTFEPQSSHQCLNQGINNPTVQTGWI